jgi:nucleotide-binding universal stress UspA family protein
MGTLIVGYDGCECADAALDEAIRLAKDTGDRIVIGFGYGPGDPGEEYKAHAEEVRKFGETATGPGLERAKAAGMEVERELVDQRPVNALLALADKHDARAIVVGTYSERPLKGALLGSTPHKLLHLSSRPVIVVPFPED